MAESPEEEQRRRRRKRLIKGLLVGGAAIGVPALLNLLIARRARLLTAATWGSGDVYPWGRNEVAFQNFGDGLPLVLLPSFGPGHSVAEWRICAGMLADSCEVFAVDLPGWGASHGFDGPYDAELYIQFLHDFLVDVVDRRAIVVAAGMSAAYAVQVAADHPELIAALGLVSPLGIGIHADRPAVKDAVVHGLLRTPVLGASALNIYTSRSGLAKYLRREVYGSPAQVDEGLVDEHYLNSHLPGAQEALAAYLSGYLNHDARVAANRLDLPVWLAWGRRAVHPPIEDADQWLKRIPHAELEVFEHVGILPHAESPSELCRKLERFLLSLRLEDLDD
jgi:pimeloyl-ACP methyl ester carboxylesterase